MIDDLNAKSVVINKEIDFHLCLVGKWGNASEKKREKKSCVNNLKINQSNQ